MSACPSAPDPTKTTSTSQGEEVKKVTGMNAKEKDNDVEIIWIAQPLRGTGACQSNTTNDAE
eukprot:9495200-Pyramimonas_sp.AAC.1